MLLRSQNLRIKVRYQPVEDKNLLYGSNLMISKSNAKKHAKLEFLKRRARLGQAAQSRCTG